ncbi:MAG: MazG-like family protein [Halanaerobium sp.]|nr:MazG-like family protein [Halanaerobium sp.]
MNISMDELQNKVGETRKERGFVQDPHQIFALLVEEVGEISAELKRLWSPNYTDFSRDDLRDEIADAQVCLFALANQFAISVNAAVEDKFFTRDAQRNWKSLSQVKDREGGC